LKEKRELQLNFLLKQETKRGIASFSFFSFKIKKY